MKKIKDIEAALDQFEDAATKHAEATEIGDYKTGNKCYVVIVRILAFLKEQDQVLALSKFLDHASVGVRMWAATFLLPFREEEGIKTLEQIAEEDGIHSLTAATTLKEWRKGNLHL